MCTRVQASVVFGWSRRHGVLANAGTASVQDADNGEGGPNAGTREMRERYSRHPILLWT